jgi:arylsulfatase A-like enzyme
MPFFAWLHTWTPHEPYLPPKPYMGVFGDAEKFNTMRKQLELGVRYHDYKPEQQEDVNILRKRYDEYILYSDNEFKLFISRLKETIDMSNTIIVLTSDHGESFSHGWQAHDGPHLYESLVRVPLIIKMPGTGEGKLIDIPVEITDIAPTILELAGIPIPEWMEGRSLVPLINGRNDSRPVFSMQLIKNKFIGNEPISKGTFAVWEGDYKLIHYLEQKKSLLFNLKQDPDELKNLFDKEPEISQHLLALIQDNLKKANERIGRGE